MDGNDHIRFFVGSRGHHADIGGITPGSTPPALPHAGGGGGGDRRFPAGGAPAEFREAEFRALLNGAARYPARSPDVNVADIKAQVAANERGVQELARVVDRYGWETVAAYMRHVMDNAEESVRRVLERLPSGSFAYTMDDGSPLRVAVTVDAAVAAARRWISPAPGRSGATISMRTPGGDPGRRPLLRSDAW